MRTILEHRLASIPVMTVIVLVLPLLFPSGYYYRVAALVFVFALAAIGLNLLMGLAGQVSLGHAGFMGIGAYAVAIGPAHLGVPSWLSFILGAALSALVAYLVGRPILRLKGHYLAVATLGFGLLLAIVFNNEAGLTGGPDGMPVPRLVLFAWPLRGPDTWYWITAASFLIGATLALNLIESPTGRALRAIHDSEVAARTLGVDVARKKLAIFVLSAVYASVAGSYFALLNGHITPRHLRVPPLDRARGHGGAGRHGVDRGLAGRRRAARGAAADADRPARLRAHGPRSDRDGGHDLPAAGIVDADERAGAAHLTFLSVLAASSS